jgi:hypothetical protein
MALRRRRLTTADRQAAGTATVLVTLVVARPTTAGAIAAGRAEDETIRLGTATAGTTIVRRAPDRMIAAPTIGETIGTAARHPVGHMMIASGTGVAMASARVTNECADHCTKSLAKAWLQGLAVVRSCLTPIQVVRAASTCTSASLSAKRNARYYKRIRAVTPSTSLAPSVPAGRETLCARRSICSRPGPRSHRAEFTLSRA